MTNELKGVDPEVRDLVFVSALLSATASTVTQVRERRFTNEELLIDLFIPKTFCEEAMEIGQNIISKLSGRLHEAAEEAIVVAGIVQSSLENAVVVIRQIEEERKNPKETTTVWTEEFSSSEELQAEFGKGGLKAYITFKTKCLKELPFKLSDGAYDEAGRYCQKLQEASSRLIVRALEYQDDLNRGVVSKDDDNGANSTQEEKAAERNEKIKSRFNLEHSGQILFDGNDLPISTGFNQEVAKKLIEELGIVVAYKELHDLSEEKQGSEQLRSAISQIRDVFKKKKVPVIVENKAKNGYFIKSK